MIVGVENYDEIYFFFKSYAVFNKYYLVFKRI